MARRDYREPRPRLFIITNGEGCVFHDPKNPDLHLFMWSELPDIIKRLRVGAYPEQGAPRLDITIYELDVWQTIDAGQFIKKEAMA